MYKGHTAFGRDAHISILLKTEEISHDTNELTEALLFLSMTSEAEEVLQFSLFLHSQGIILQQLEVKKRQVYPCMM